MSPSSRFVLLLPVSLGLLAATPAADPVGSVVPSRSWDILSLHLDITVDPDARTVQGTARYTARPLHPGPLVLDRVDIDILEVRGRDTAAPPHRVEPGKLVIGADSDHLGADGTLDFEVDFLARPWTGVHFRSAPVDAYAEVWTQGQRDDHHHWFPSWDHPNERFDYTGTVHAPDGWRAHTNSGHDLPNYLIMFAAGPYKEIVHATDPTTRVWVPPNTPADAIDHVLDPVPAMKAHFHERTGQQYPWGDYLQVFVQRFLYFGMENTGATINAARALTDSRVARTRPRVENLIAHELAHQWFGDLLTCETWRDLWLNEGFATFMAGDYVAMRHTRSEDQEAAWAEMVLRWHQHSAQQPQPMARRWHHEGGADAHNVYNRGAATLGMLQAQLGDDTFWRGVQAYVEQHAHGSVETVDLRRAMEQVSGRDLRGFFQQWTERTGSPTLTVSERHVGDELVVTVKQETSETMPVFHIPVEVTVAVGGERVTASDWMDDDTLQLRLPITGEVQWVAIDPHGAVLGKWTHSQAAARLEAQALNAPPVARLRAIDALSETDASQALETILINPDEPLPYRTAAADALGKQRASGPLLESVGSDDDAVRLAVAGALGSCPDPAVVPVLKRMASSDRNPDIRGAALAALAKVAPEQAVRQARIALRATELESTWLVSEAAEVLGGHGTAKDLGLLLRPDQPFKNRNASLRAAARWVRSQPDPAVRKSTGARVARAAEALLADLDLRTRQDAIHVLSQIGDDASISLLEAHRRATRVESEQDSAARAIRAISGRSEPEWRDPAAEQAATLEHLERRVNELEKRLDEQEDRH